MRCPYGHRTGPAREFSMFFTFYGTHTGPMYDPQGCRTAPLWTRKRIDTNRIGKNPARASYLAAQSLHRLFTGCLWFLNLYGACKLIMHALKLYGPRTGRQNSYGACADSMSGGTTAWEQPVWGPGVWCGWGITQHWIKWWLGDKPFAEPVVMKMSDTLWHHQATMS